MATQHSRRGKSIPPDPQKATTNGKRKPTKEPDNKPDLSATGIVRLATEGLTLFHTPLREAFASVWVRGHWETYRVKSTACEEWLFAMFYHQYISL